MLFIAENLKTLRRQKNMTQEDVAQILNVSPQSVSKWERGDTYPDITLLPSIANLFDTSVDTLIGMDKIRDTNTKDSIYVAEKAAMATGDYSAAISILNEALKTYPNDDGFTSELIMALTLDGEPASLTRAMLLAEQVLSKRLNEKRYHTLRVALSFIYLKTGETERAVSNAKNLPHIRESRETIL